MEKNKLLPQLRSEDGGKLMEELIKRLRDSEHKIDCSLCDRDCCYPDGKVHGKCIIIEAADAIEELSAKVESLQFFADNISKLPDCNTCLKKDLCEFMPKYGEYCRINCPAWLGQPPKEE